MMKKLRFISLFVFVIGNVLNIQAQNSLPVYLDETRPVEERIENALSLMTLSEKVALCHAQSKFSSPGVPRLGIPELWMSDGPHGVREEILWDSWSPAKWSSDSCIAFPALTCLAATFNPDMSQIYGKAIGEEARYRNKSVLLGPGVNIYRTPLNGRNFEYMGEDPYLASQMVVPYVNGVQQNGVAACVKHFALNNQEKWRGHIDVQVSDRALYEIYLPAFRAAVVDGKAWAIMGSYNQLRGQHCCHNDLLLNKILKGEWKFDGAVITDWGGAHSTMEAAFNGLDIEMGTGTDGMTFSKTNAYDNYYLAKPFLNAIRNGEVPEQVVNEKARRILRLIFRTSMNRNKPFGSFGSEAHAGVDLKVAEEGIVLLKNNKGILPITTRAIKTIAVIGENAIRKMTLGGGSSELKAKYEISPLQGLKERFGDSVRIVYSKGYASGQPMWGRELQSGYNEDSLRTAAVNAAKGADLVLFIGGLNKNHHQDCEGGDRLQYNLPFGQDQLIDEISKVNRNTVVVLISGNAVEMPWINKTQAVVQAWYLGSEAGHALAAVLSGDVNPSGKLPFSFPVKLTDNGANAFDREAYPGDSIKEVYKEDILVGYRWFDTKNIAPLFAFGHGLSYTTFSYGKVTADKKEYKDGDHAKISFVITNTGKVAGQEAAQIYITEKSASVPRPAKELKAFKKIFLNPGESKQVEIDMPIKDWAFYNDLKKEWTLEPGEFIIQVGSSSRDIRQKISVSIK